MGSSITKFGHLQIPLEDVLEATNNFDDKNVISHDGLGKLYKGKLLRSGKWVNIAARRFDSKHKPGIDFLREISVLSRLKHDNIVSIIGFCDEKGEKVIINKYEAEGSLEMHLSKPSLTWVQRLKICIGVARALSYIHYEDGRSYSQIHRNINSSMILLDDKFEPKLSGFEYSIRCSDIYSFGVVLWEIIYERKAFIPDEFDRYLAPLAEFRFENNQVDAILRFLNGEIGRSSLIPFMQSAYLCTNDKRAQRPEMNFIVNQLEKALEFQLQYESLYRPNLERLTSQLSHMKIRLRDIRLATDHFSWTYYRLPTMFYDVYRARPKDWDKRNSSSVEQQRNKSERLERRTTVFIKRLRPREDKSEEKVFGTDIEMLTTCKHRNIGTLLGFCDEDEEKILVIEAASKGLLSEYFLSHLHRDKSVLSWEKRLKICLDVAYGLKYLHHEMEDQKSVIMCHFTSSSISLDENFGAKIVYLGSSMFLPPNQKFLQLNSFCGTIFYSDPQYHEEGKLTRKSDVYTFGVVLFEILCGRLAHDEMYLKESKAGLVDVARRCFVKGTLMEIIDPSIITEAKKNSIDTFVEIAYRCVAETQAQRPDMKSVVNKLEKVLELQLRNTESEISNFSHLKIPLEDVLEATENFDEKNVIRHGGLGKVYKGKLLRSGKWVKIAACRLDSKHKLGIEFLTEISALCSLKHENIVSLIGFCDEKGEKVIINKLEEKGSLAMYLSKPTLTWVQRFKICVGVARALSYMHYQDGRSYSVIHCNINSSTILLDDKFEPKLSGFEYSIHRSVHEMDKVLITEAIGTTGYVDPAILKTGGVTYKSDIYAFGVVLFEILFMREAFIPDEFDRFLAPLARFVYENSIVDGIQPFRNNEIGWMSLSNFLRVAYICSCHEGAQRPNMKSIVNDLEKVLEFQLQHEKFYVRASFCYHIFVC
ncbi:uncharacterized protein [Rutidosis leptorrhynchoides]|uniref:uncharacterized protein n=1 Tax=Rutidosis leptorrhynchoides TaxID=125765 RepID=UPI003A9A533F